MAKEILRIEKIDEGVRVTCEDTREMAAAVGAFLYKAIMDRNTDHVMAFLQIFMMLSNLLSSEAKKGFLNCIKEALEIPQK